MVETVEDLNYDFNYNLFLGKTMLSRLNKQEDRTKAVNWMKKLGTCNRSLNEMKLRNDFMYYLIVNIQHGELQTPFTDHPPTTPLPEMAHLLADTATGHDDADAWGVDDASKQKKPLLYEHSPDGGNFLASQPVPRCGAFCYLAVVARHKPENND